MTQRKENKLDANATLDDYLPSWQKPSKLSAMVEQYDKVLYKRTFNWGAIVWNVVSWLSIAFVAAMFIDAALRNS